MSLATSTVAGALLGGVLTTTIGGAAAGAFMAVPAGAVVALTLWSLGSVTLQAFTPHTATWRRRRWRLRVIFGVLAGCVIGVELAVTFAVLGGATRESLVWIAAPALAVMVAGCWYPPHTQRLPTLT